MRITMKETEKRLNEIGVPTHDHPENGGRVPWRMVERYGTWLRKHDSIAFQLAKMDLETR